MSPRHLWILASCLCPLTAAHADLTAAFSAGGSSDTRIDRLPALHVAEGEPATPFLEPGPFEVRWTGKLALNDRQRLYFSFEGEGEAALTIDGEEVLTETGALGEAESDRIRLNPGEHDLEVTYRSTDAGTGSFRLFWKGRFSPRQSIPPTTFQTETEHAPERLGRKLFAEAHCAKCHMPETGTFGSSAMPEVSELAPLLGNTGGRLNEEWLTEWIAAPHEVRPGTMMPAVVDADTPEGRQEAADLAAWLSGMNISPAPEEPDPELAQSGGAHFHRFGCVACHSRPDGPRDPERIPLDRVAGKYQPGALVGFLKNPSQWAPHTDMPNFGLGDDEAESLAAWLLKSSADNEPEDTPDFPEGDAGRGEALAKRHNCGACHAGLPLDVAEIPSLEAIFEKDWTQTGCLTDAEGLPDFNFNEEQAAQLNAFAGTDPASLKRHVPAEYAARQLEHLRCTSCHRVDELDPLLSKTHLDTEDLVAHVAGEDEKLDQSRPHLTLAGEMLHASYMERMIDGDERARPWLDMRMPGYQGRAANLADGLARIHGVEPGEPEPPEPDPELAAIGKTLVGTDGFGCTTCHAVGDKKATAAFEVAGVNFDLAHQRLRKEWYMRWMDNPRAITPNTKMPLYSERGESQRTDILDGDAAAQFDAIWQYLLTVAEETEE